MRQVNADFLHTYGLFRLNCSQQNCNGSTTFLKNDSRHLLPVESMFLPRKHHSTASAYGSPASPLTDRDHSSATARSSAKAKSVDEPGSPPAIAHCFRMS
ncbi:hypothetical protein GJ744_008425 [Endocarpon pusillum]|uniref:Uncharacterized protein n=1 Tax=Endocarpon pusillum TaxID=364733 RepID=A0A8H7APX5_9EURO|nr:hypothetical protein GJ744_008425 [Endocarpon pusillum]